MPAPDGKQTAESFKLDIANANWTHGRRLLKKMQQNARLETEKLQALVSWRRLTEKNREKFDGHRLRPFPKAVL